MNRHDSIIPSFIDNLVIRARALLPGVNISDGEPVINNSGDYLGIGTEDPIPDRSYSAESEQRRVGATRTSGREEDGTLVCSAYTWHADLRDDAAKVARDKLFAILAVVSDELRDNPGLESTPGNPATRVQGLQWSEIASTQLVQWQQDGTQALLVFRIHFRARI